MTARAPPLPFGFHKPFPSRKSQTHGTNPVDSPLSTAESSFLVKPLGLHLPRIIAGVSNLIFTSPDQGAYTLRQLARGGFNAVAADDCDDTALDAVNSYIGSDRSRYGPLLLTYAPTLVYSEDAVHRAVAGLIARAGAEACTVLFFHPWDIDALPRSITTVSRACVKSCAMAPLRDLPFAIADADRAVAASFTATSSFPRLGPPPAPPASGAVGAPRTACSLPQSVAGTAPASPFTVGPASSHAAHHIAALRGGPTYSAATAAARTAVGAMHRGGRALARSVGLANVTAAQLEMAVHSLRAAELPPPAAVTVAFSVIDTRPLGDRARQHSRAQGAAVDTAAAVGVPPPFIVGGGVGAPDSLVSVCVVNDIALMPYAVLCGGLLSDKWLSRGPPSQDELRDPALCRGLAVVEAAGGWHHLQAVLRVLRNVGLRHGVSIASVAIRWVLEQAAVASAIIGVSPDANPDHFADYTRAFGWKVRACRLLRSVPDSSFVTSMLSAKCTFP